MDGRRDNRFPDVKLPATLMHRARAASGWLTLVRCWLLLSGSYTPFRLGGGVVAALAVTALAVRMSLVDGEGHPIHLGLLAFFWYWPWLIKEIVKSALHVARIILHPNLPIAPSIVRFAPSQRSDIGVVIHANSITLTPGTVCIEANRGEFIVHALTRESAAGLGPGSGIDRRVLRLERNE